MQGSLPRHFLSERRRRRAGGATNLRRVPGGRGSASSTPSTSGWTTVCGAASPSVSAGGCSAAVGSDTPSPSEPWPEAADVGGVGSLAECVVNISEGRDPATIEALRDAGGAAVLDVHSDPEHHRSVLTLGGTLETVEEAARRVVSSAVARIDLRSHAGAHPRLGVADVVPFVPLPSLSPATRSEFARGRAPPARRARREDRFASWAGAELELPCFLYGPERSLPDVRRGAFTSLDSGCRAVDAPSHGGEHGGRAPGPCSSRTTCGSPADGDAGTDAGRAHALSVARSLAAELRGPSVRSLGLPVGGGRPGQFQPDRPGFGLRGRASTTRWRPGPSRRAARCSGPSSSGWYRPAPSSRCRATAGPNSTWTRTGPSRALSKRSGRRRAVGGGPVGAGR